MSSSWHHKYPHVPVEILDALSYGDMYTAAEELFQFMGGLSGTTHWQWAIGPADTSHNIEIRANLGGPNDPILRYDKTEHKWKYSNDGITFVDIGTGGGGGSGVSGYSGYSGDSGVPGGTSGYSGYSGATGAGGGESGASGVSGYSGLYGQSGISGYSGAKGSDGSVGASGSAGVSGASGASGSSGAVGYSGSVGLSGVSGFSGAAGSGSGPVAFSGLTDVEALNPVRDQVPKWNGVAWVPAAYNATFAMTISSFSDNQTTPILIGTGTWVATGALSFTASYVNPPPASASIGIGGTGGVTWSAPLTLTTPFTSKSATENTSYPASKDVTVTFTLTAYDGATPRTSTITRTFYNNVKYGITTATGGWDSAAVNALVGTLLSNAYAGSFPVNSGSGQYVLYAHPSSYTSINTLGFLFNGMTCPFEAPVTVSVTNPSGFIENYKV